MKLLITHNWGTTEITIKDIYNEEMLLEALENSSTIALTKEDGKAYILQTSNVVSIEIV